MNAVCKDCKLNCNIEECRKMLNKVIVEKEYNLLESDVINLSQSLDNLIHICVLCENNLQVI